MHYYKLWSLCRSRSRSRERWSISYMWCVQRLNFFLLECLSLTWTRDLRRSCWDEETTMCRLFLPSPPPPPHTLTQTGDSASNEEQFGRGRKGNPILGALVALPLFFLTERGLLLPPPPSSCSKSCLSVSLSLSPSSPPFQTPTRRYLHLQAKHLPGWNHTSALFFLVLLFRHAPLASFFPISWEFFSSSSFPSPLSLKDQHKSGEKTSIIACSDSPDIKSIFHNHHLSLLWDVWDPCVRNTKISIWYAGVLIRVQDGPLLGRRSRSRIFEGGGRLKFVMRNIDGRRDVGVCFSSSSSSSSFYERLIPLPLRFLQPPRKERKKIISKVWNGFSSRHVCIWFSFLLSFQLGFLFLRHQFPRLSSSFPPPHASRTLCHPFFSSSSENKKKYFLKKKKETCSNFFLFFFSSVWGNCWKTFFFSFLVLSVFGELLADGKKVSSPSLTAFFFLLLLPYIDLNRRNWLIDRRTERARKRRQKSGRKD